jgi:hypothetical protein
VGMGSEGCRSGEVLPHLFAFELALPYVVIRASAIIMLNSHICFSYNNEKYIHAPRQIEGFSVGRSVSRSVGEAIVGGCCQLSACFLDKFFLSGVQGAGAVPAGCCGAVPEMHGYRPPKSALCSGAGGSHGSPPPCP